MPRMYVHRMDFGSVATTLSIDDLERERESLLARICSCLYSPKAPWGENAQCGTCF